MPKLTASDFDELVNSIIDNLINGNRSDALEQFKTMNTLQSGFAAIMIYEAELITPVNKRWIMSAMYQG